MEMDRYMKEELQMGRCKGREFITMLNVRHIIVEDGIKVLKKVKAIISANRRSTKEAGVKDKSTVKVIMKIN